MGCLVQLFTLEELKALDERHLAILRDAILSEVRTSPEIREVLRAKLRPVYDQLKPQEAPRKRARGSGSRSATRKK
jgi:hypothetical protein